MKQQIPNLITAGNLLCGCMAILNASQGLLIEASVFVLLGALLDLFDGMIARILAVDHPLGAQLDSLADAVSFGVAPSFILYFHLEGILSGMVNYGAFSLAVFSAYRLAKFNIDEEQKTSFKGLPTPANALFWISIPLILWQIEEGLGLLDVSVFLGLLEQKIILILLCFILSFLMVSNLPLVAFKFANLRWKGNEPKFILIGFGVVIIPIFLLASIPIMLLLYLLVSLLYSSKKDT